jgi:hypothetical protein
MSTKWHVWKNADHFWGNSTTLEEIGHCRTLAVLSAFEKYRMRFWWYRVLKWFGLES